MNTDDMKRNWHETMGENKTRNVSITTAIFKKDAFFFHKVVFGILTSDFVTKGNFETYTI